MDLEQLWQKALRNTQITKTRLGKLHTFTKTELPYVFLAESEVNIGNTVVRKGKIVVDKPLIFLPDSSPQFYGFDFEKNLKVTTDTMKTFLFMRGVMFPSLKYTHVSELDVYEGGLNEAVKEYSNQLEKEENIDTGLIMGLADSWQFSVLIYVANLVIKSVPEDIEKFMQKFRDNQNHH